MLHLQKFISPPALSQADVTCLVLQQQSLILHLLLGPDRAASASIPDRSGKSRAPVRAAAICCWRALRLTQFIFDPNPRRAEEQPLCCGAAKTISALTDSGSVHQNELSRGRNLATFHVRQSVWQRTSGSHRELSFKVVFPLPQTRMIKDDSVSPEQ